MRRVSTGLIPALVVAVKATAERAELAEKSISLRSLRALRLLSFFVAVVALVATQAAAGAQNPGGSVEGKKIKNPVAATPDSIKAGQASFQKYCRFCHGADAKGNGPMAPKDTHPSDLTDAKWDRGSTEGELFLVIKEGAGPKFDMKGLKSKMTDQEIWNVINYLRSIQAK